MRRIFRIHGGSLKYTTHSTDDGNETYDDDQYGCLVVAGVVFALSQPSEPDVLLLCDQNFHDGDNGVPHYVDLVQCETCFHQER